MVASCKTPPVARLGGIQVQVPPFIVVSAITILTVVIFATGENVSAMGRVH